MSVTAAPSKPSDESTACCATCARATVPDRRALTEVRSRLAHSLLYVFVPVVTGLQQLVSPRAEWQYWLSVSDDHVRSMVERFDAHPSRSDDLFERNTQAFERNTRAWRRTVSALESLHESIEDMSDRIRANTPATLNILDRLDSGESGG